MSIPKQYVILSLPDNTVFECIIQRRTNERWHVYEIVFDVHEMLGAGSSWNYLNILLFSQESPSSSWKLKILESESKHLNIWCGGRKTGKPHKWHPWQSLFLQQNKKHEDKHRDKLKDKHRQDRLTYVQNKQTLIRTNHAMASFAVLIPPAGLNPTRKPVASWYSLSTGNILVFDDAKHYS